MFCSFFIYSQHGDLDPNFNYFPSGYSVFDGPNYEVFDVEVQSDGKFLIGGSFNQYQGNTAIRFIRTLESGVPDPGFDQSSVLPNGSVRTIVEQANGKILIGGIFSSYGTDNTRLVRLNSDGTRDFSLSNAITNGGIGKIIVQQDGKIVVVGSFTEWNGVSSNNIVRLESNGTIDASFDIGLGANDWISDVQQTSTGELILVGDFTEFNGTSCNGYIQLLPDGNVDPSFTAVAIPSSDYLRSIQIQPNGKILIGATVKVFRIEEDGTLDPSFTIGTSNSIMRGITLLSNGKIAAYGMHNSYNGFNSGEVTLLNSDGTVDTGFSIYLNGGSSTKVSDVAETMSGDLLLGGDFNIVNSNSADMMIVLDQTGQLQNGEVGFNWIVNDVSVQPDDKVLVGGAFGSYNGTNCSGLVRLNADGSMDSTFQSSLFSVNDTYILPNGKILVASAVNVARLNTDGSVDNTFTSPSFTNGEVYSIDVQTDGKILVAGSFRYVDGDMSYYVARLEENGAVDQSFNSLLFDNVTFQMQARKVKQLSSGKIMLTGRFGCCPPVLRLNSNGSFDNSFHLNSTAFRIYDFIELDDGDIIIGGVWSSYGGHSTYFLHRLNPNGTFDLGFNDMNGGSSGYTSNRVESLKRISDDEILVSGVFPEIAGVRRSCFLVDNDGNRDATFDVNESFTGIGVYGVGVQSDTSIIIGGQYESVGLYLRNNISRLNYTQPDVSNVSLAEITTDQLNLYPNPVESGGALSIENLEGNIVSIEIYNLQGQQISSVQLINESQIRIPFNLESGMYELKIISKNKAWVKSIVVK